MKLGRILGWLPSLAVGALCFIIVATKIWLSGKSLGHLSIEMMVGAGAVSIVGAYFLLSAFAERARRRNNAFIMIVVLCLIGTEAVLRIAEDLIPQPLALMLPIEDRHKILEDRGLFTTRALQGEGLLYRYKPGWKIKSQPWVKIDEHGYRNPPNQNQADVVVLGDSTSINMRSQKDIGAVMRDLGLSVINLAFSGYGTRHQLEAYNRMIIERRVPHKVVLVNFCICNDLPDSESYERMEKLGRDWKSTRGTVVSATPFPFPFKPPWVVSIIAHSPEAFVQKYIRSLSSSDTRVPIGLARGDVELNESVFRERREFLEVESWQPALRALKNIVQLARSAGAKTMIGLWPDLALIYGPSIKERPDLTANAERLHVMAVQQLKAAAAQTGAAFFDYTPHMRRANDTDMAVVFEGNYHPGQIGVNVMADVAASEIRSALAK